MTLEAQVLKAGIHLELCYNFRPLVTTLIRAHLQAPVGVAGVRACRSKSAILWE